MSVAICPFLLENNNSVIAIAPSGLSRIASQTWQLRNITSQKALPQLGSQGPFDPESCTILLVSKRL